MADKQTTPMGYISRAHIQPLGRPQQATTGPAHGVGINVVKNDVEVCLEGGRSGCEGGLRDGPTL